MLSPNLTFLRIKYLSLNGHLCPSAIRLRNGFLKFSVFEDLLIMSRKPCPI